MVGWIWSHTNYFAEMHCAHKNTDPNLTHALEKNIKQKREEIQIKKPNKMQRMVHIIFFLIVTLLLEARIVICRLCFIGLN